MAGKYWKANRASTAKRVFRFKELKLLIPTDVFG